MDAKITCKKCIWHELAGPEFNKKRSFLWMQKLTTCALKSRNCITRENNPFCATFFHVAHVSLALEHTTKAWRSVMAFGRSIAFVNGCQACIHSNEIHSLKTTRPRTKTVYRSWDRWRRTQIPQKISKRLARVWSDALKFSKFSSCGVKSICGNCRRECHTTSIRTSWYVLNGNLSQAIFRNSELVAPKQLLTRVRKRSWFWKCISRTW